MERTRELVRRRPDVEPGDVDEVVAIAAELQDEDRRRAEAPTVAEVEAVASELDVDPAYVQPAIDALRRRRADSEAAEKAARVEEAGRATQRARIGRLVGAALLGVLLLGSGASLLSARSAATAIRAADTEVARTEGALAAVLDRQQQLVPPLVALAGGTIAVPRPDPRASIEERLRQADALSAELTRALATLPPADPATSQERLNLQYELTGTQNRISVERRRWQDARVARDAADDRFGAGLAETLGWTTL